jgi:opacity protein-like surface antigen
MIMMRSFLAIVGWFALSASMVSSSDPIQAPTESPTYWDFAGIPTVQPPTSEPPTSQPTIEPTPPPSPEPTPKPTIEPTPLPTPEPTPAVYPSKYYEFKSSGYQGDGINAYYGYGKQNQAYVQHQHGYYNQQGYNGYQGYNQGDTMGIKSTGNLSLSKDGEMMLGEAVERGLDK